MSKSTFSSKVAQTFAQRLALLCAGCKIGPYVLNHTFFIYRLLSFILGPCLTFNILHSLPNLESYIILSIPCILHVLLLHHISTLYILIPLFRCYASCCTYFVSRSMSYVLHLTFYIQCPGSCTSSASALYRISHILCPTVYPALYNLHPTYLIHIRPWTRI